MVGIEPACVSHLSPPQNSWFCVTGRPLFGLLTLLLCFSAARADDWPQWLGPQRDGVWRETGILDKFPADGPKVQWRTPIGGGYAGPAVAGGKVYVTDRVLAPGVKNPDNLFARSTINGTERVLCIDEASGTVLWTHEYDCPYQVSYPAGPRTTPVIQGGKVYTVGAMGDLICLDAGSGKVLWSKNFHKDNDAPVQMWGFSGHPLVDGDKLICLVGGEGSVVVAFHKDTGKELWKALSAKAQGYCPPMIYEAGGKRQLIIWDADSVNSLDPETGKVYWTEKFPLHQSNMSISTPRMNNGQLFITSFYNGSLMLKLDSDKPTASVAWRRKGRSEQPDQTDALHSIISTPFFKEEYIYGVCSYGDLRCLKADNGDRVWSTRKATTSDDSPTRWANAFLVAQGDRFFLFNEQGDLIIARLTPKGYDEIGRAHILVPTGRAGFGGQVRNVLWSHPAFANKSMYARNDKEIVCVSLAAE